MVDRAWVLVWHKENIDPMKKIALALLSILALAGSSQAEPLSRCLELRIYYAAPGKLDDLNARFRNHTAKLFAKHGIFVPFYWVPVENPDNKLVYLVVTRDRDTAKKNWEAFGADPEWKEVVKASEAKGKLVTNVESIYLEPVNLGGKLVNFDESQKHLYELRTYKAAEGKLPDLLNRFRNHTTTLFTKHGLNQLGYWRPTDKAKGADDTLIYLLAHTNKEGAEAAWKAFRADPAWVAAKKASEVNGPLTSKVEGVYLTPTDYSPRQ